MSARTIKKVAISSLTKAPFNPQRRAENVNALTKSIETHGLFYPILLEKGTTKVVDGHRRLAAAERLGWTEIDAIETDVAQETAYGEINYNAKSLSGNEVLQIWLTNPGAISSRAVGKCERAEELLGRPMLEKLAEEGYSLRILGRAKEIARYVGAEDNPRFIRKALKWLLSFGTWEMAQAISDRQPVGKIKKLVDEGKPIRFRVAG